MAEFQRVQMILTVQSLAAARAAPSMICERHVHEYVQRHGIDDNGQHRPEEQVRKEAIRSLCKTHHMQDVEGSPAWWERQLRNLKAMCQTYGLPDLFLTLTCDEVSESRFEEIAELEDLAMAVTSLLNPGPDGRQPNLDKLNDFPPWAVGDNSILLAGRCRCC